MSKKTAEEHGGDKGDAPNNSFPNRHLPRASCDKTHQGTASVNAGPFGDSPPENSSNKYFIFMMDNNDDDEYEDDELANEYYMRINTLREKLQQMELMDESIEDDIGLLSSRHGCKITEIIDSESEHLKDINSNRTLSSNASSEKPDKEDAQTLGFTQNFNFQMPTEHFDVDYNPPKKRHCWREVSPKIHSISSEAYMKYPFFKRNSNNLSNDGLFKSNDYHRNCSNESGDVIKPTDVDSKPASAMETHIFPNVIIKTSDTHEGVETLFQAKSAFTEKNKLHSPESEESLIYSSISTTVSGISSAKSENLLKSKPNIEICQKRSRSIPTSARNKIGTTEHMTLWEEIKKLQSISDSKVHETALEIVPVKSDKSIILIPEQDDSTIVSLWRRLSNNVCNRKEKKDRYKKEEYESVENIIVFTEEYEESMKNVKPTEKSKKIVKPEIVSDKDNQSGAHTNMPSNVIEEFIKPQEVAYKCYRTTSQHSKQSEVHSNSINESRFTRFCSYCFCGPFTSTRE